MKKILIFITILCIISSAQASDKNNQPWRFAVLGDTHVGSSDTLAAMIPYLLADSIDCVLMTGDIVEGGLACTGAQLQTQLDTWKAITAPLYAAGIGIYPIRGNHENDAHNNLTVWNNSFSGQYALPQNGPTGELNLTYSFTNKNALFIGLDSYVDLHKINQSWLDGQLAANTEPHIFVFAHEAAFKVFHADCLDDSLTARNIFWNSLTESGVRIFFCGHDHFADAALVEDNDGNPDNNIYQYLIGTGGGWLMNQYSNYNGTNSPYTLTRNFHDMEHGYALVEVSGDGLFDKNVTITWKKRTFNPQTSHYEYLPTTNVITFSSNTSIDQSEVTPEGFELKQNYPNPFNPSTTISFSMPKTNKVVLSIYNARGQLVDEPINSNLSAGNHTINFKASGLESGIYFTQLQIANNVLTRKMVLCK